MTIEQQGLNSTRVEEKTAKERALKRWNRWLGVSVCLLVTSSAQADVHDLFGVGARSIGLGNAQTAAVKGGAGAYYNPGALGFTRRTTVELGSQLFMPRLGSLEGVVYDANQNGEIDVAADGTPENTEVGTAYAPAMGMGLNAALKLNSRLIFGASAYIPSQWLMRLQFQDVYVPYYVMYKNRPQAFSAYMGLGFRVFEGMSVGVGGSVSTRLTVNGRITSNTTVQSGQTDPTTGEALPTEVNAQVNLDDLTVQVKSAIAPTVGVMMNFGWLSDHLAGLNLGLMSRAASHLDTQATVVTAAYGSLQVDSEQVFSGPLTPEPLTVEQKLSNAVNAAQVAGGLAYTHKDRLTVSVDAVLTRWSEYQETFISLGNSIVVENTAVVDVQVGRETSYRTEDSLDPGMVWKDTVTPRVGLEYVVMNPEADEKKLQLAVRGGYGYAPSPLPEQSWRVNMLDSDKHMVSVGAGLAIPVRGLAHPLKVDAFVAAHLLKERVHQKEEDMVAFLGSAPVGSPISGQYVSSGMVLGTGATVGLQF